jgi:uncharacterized membrane protein YeiH
MDPVAAAPWLLLALDLLGVFVFALSGGLAAVRQRFDVVGVLVLAVAAGLGGGMLRDVLIGAVPPVGISDWRLLSAAAAAGIITFLFHPRLSRIARAVTLLDALGLGLFAVAGTLKALELGTTALTAVVVGVLTAVGGGAVRDLLAGGPPRVLVEREFYAIPAILGAVVYASLWSAGLVSPLVTWGCVVLTVTVRMLALRLNWQAPAPRPPHVET